MCPGCRRSLDPAPLRTLSSISLGFFSVRQICQYEGTVAARAYSLFSAFTKSHARHRYQVATEHHGLQRLARFCISAGLGRSAGVTLSVGLSLPKVRENPLRTP